VVYKQPYLSAEVEIQKHLKNDWSVFYVEMAATGLVDADVKN